MGNSLFFLGRKLEHEYLKEIAVFSREVSAQRALDVGVGAAWESLCLETLMKPLKIPAFIKLQDYRAFQSWSSS